MKVSETRQKKRGGITYLCFLNRRGLGLMVAAFFPEADIVVKLRDPFVGLRYFLGEGFSKALAAVLCFSSSSPMLIFLRATGIRLTRRSIRDRRSCAWSAYCARSLRALSVTGEYQLGLWTTEKRTYFQAVGYPSRSVSGFA